MNRILASFLLLPMLGWAELSTADRQHLVAHLEMTENWLAVEIGSLTPAQLSFQPTPEAWSIHNVLEHLAIAEPQYWKQVQEALAKGPTSYQTKVKDADILWYGIDRTRRAKTGAAREPKGQYAKTAAAHADFTKLRQTMLTFARDTSADLRAIQLIDSPMDLYQWCLMISTHAQRHILQIREIKTNPAYPK